MFSRKPIYRLFSKTSGGGGGLLKPARKQKGARGKTVADAWTDEMSYVVFDTELTGLKVKNDSIVSIGAVKMNGGRIEMGEVFYRIVRPRSALSSKSIVIHEITPTEAAESPDIDTLLPEFLDFCGDSVLVGHFVSIDLAFINKEMQRLYGADIRNLAVDTGRIYSWLRRRGAETCAFQGETHEDLSLRAVALKHGVPVNGSHNALADAFMTAQIFQRLLSELGSHGITKVVDLVRIGKPLRS